MGQQFSKLLGGAVTTDHMSTLDVPPDWMQGRSVFGGLQAALAVRAMRTLATTPLRTLQATFIGPIAGRMTASATVLRAGGNAVHVEARIHGEDGVLATLAVGVFGKPRASAVAVTPVQPEVQPGQPVELRFDGVVPSFIQHFRARWLRGSLPFTGGGDQSHVIEVGLRDDARASEAHVIALADFVPPLGLSYLRAPANGSTLTWMLEFLTETFDHGLTGWRVDADLLAARDGAHQKR